MHSLSFSPMLGLVCFGKSFFEWWVPINDSGNYSHIGGGASQVGRRDLKDKLSWWADPRIHKSTRLQKSQVILKEPGQEMRAKPHQNSEQNRELKIINIWTLSIESAEEWSEFHGERVQIITNIPELIQASFIPTYLQHRPLCSATLHSISSILLFIVSQQRLKIELCVLRVLHVLRFYHHCNLTI